IFVSQNVEVKEITKWRRETKKSKREIKTYNLFRLDFTCRTSTEKLLDSFPNTSTGETIAVDPIPQKIVEEEDKVQIQEGIQADSNIQLDTFQTETTSHQNIKMILGYGEILSKTCEISGVKEILRNVNILKMIFSGFMQAV
ncbi:hypothetical protein TNCT_106721, partial [Trichonephila clavata]